MGVHHPLGERPGSGLRPDVPTPTVQPYLSVPDSSKNKKNTKEQDNPVSKRSKSRVPFGEFSHNPTAHNP